MDGSRVGRVIVEIRNSVSGYQALRYATDLARQRGLALVAVRATRRSSPGETLPMHEALISAATADTTEVFEIALGGLPPGVVVEIVANEGMIGEILVSTADRDADLLVIAGCDPGWFTGLRSAALARFCARRATCPVVIVPPPALARTGRQRRMARATARDAERFLTSPRSHPGTAP